MEIWMPRLPERLDRRSQTNARSSLACDSHGNPLHLEARLDHVSERKCGA
jgi:hypothetical protein